jgi:hypothetical protein
MNSNEILTKTGNVLRKISMSIELVYIFLMILAFILRLLSTEHSGLILSLVYLIVAAIYFFSGFADNYEGEISAISRFFHKLFEFSSAVTCLGILFRLEGWRNNMIFVTVGVVTLVVSFCWIYLTRSRNAEKAGIEPNIIFRTIALLGITLILFLLTSK